jgi:hypothetical protein
VTEVLEGHVGLDIQCPDRFYLNCYQPKPQTSAQVVAFLSGHLDIRSRHRCWGLRQERALSEHLR